MTEYINLQNAKNGLCIICGEPNLNNRMTCDLPCHEKFVRYLEKKLAMAKKVVDSTTNIACKVPIRDLIERNE